MLTPFTAVTQQQLREARDPLGTRFQCLRCGCEFKPEETRLGPDGEEGWRPPLFQKTGTNLAPDFPAHTASPLQGRQL